MRSLPFSEVSQRFLDAFAYLEQSVSVVDRYEQDGISWLHWPQVGRRGGRFHYEFFGTDCNPDIMTRVVRTVDPRQPYFISDIYGRRGPAVAEFARAGYETRFQEPMMLLDLEPGSYRTSETEVTDVDSLALADRIFSAFEQSGEHARQTSLKQIEDPQTLIKAILVDGEPAATGKGVLLGDTLYVTDIGTISAFRKRGFGAAIVTSLHTSAMERGAVTSILSATQMAAGLYRSLGYRDIGTLDIYEPINQL